MQQNLKEIYRYLKTFYRYRYLSTVVALLIMTAIGAYSFTLPKLFQVETTVFIEKNIIDNLVKGIAVTPSIDAKIRVLKYAILSRNLIVKTLEEIDSEIFTKSKAEQQNYIEGLQEQIKINIRGKDLFIVSLIGGDPAFVQNFVNTLVGKYVEENISLKRDEAYGANRFLAEQINIFKKKLEKSEDAIIDFRKKQGIYFSVDEQTIVSEIKNYMTEIEAVGLSIETLVANKSQLQGQLETLSPTIESLFSIDGIDDELGGIAANPQLIAMKSRLSNLRLRYTDNYPEIIRLNFEIEGLKIRLAEQEKHLAEQELEMPKAGGSKMTSLNPLYLDVQQRLLEVQSEMTSQQAKKQSLERMVTKREKELHNVPATKKQLNVLIQQRDSHKKIYQELLGRMEQSEVSKQMEISNKAATFRIVDMAVYPETPISPNMSKMFLLAVIGGLAGLFGLIFLLENIDTRVRNVRIFEELGVDILAIVPSIVDPGEIKRCRQRDFYFFAMTGVYFCCFSGVFVYQIFMR